MDFLLRLAGRFDAIARQCGRLAAWIILPLIFIIMFDVVTRKLDVTRLWFSDLSIAWGGISISTIFQDLQWHFHAILMMMTFAIGYLTNAHVRVDIFRELLPKRKQAWVEFIEEAWQLTSLAFGQGEGSESLTGIGKRWMIKSVVLIGFSLLMLAVLATLFRLGAMLFGTEEQGLRGNKALAIFPGDAGDLEAARLAAEAALQDEIDATELAEKLAREKRDREQ